jgi:hypothetical protein
MIIFDIKIIVIIGLILLLILLYYGSVVSKDSILDRYTEKLSTISGFFIGIGIYLTFMIFSVTRQNFSNELTYKIIDRGWINVNLKFVEYYDKCPNFVESLYFPWQKTNLQYKIDSPKIDKNDVWYAVNYLSIIIFQSFEDFLTANQNDETGDYVWLCNYLQWVNSPILENRWNVLKSNYANTTIKFGDLLFNKISIVKINNTNELKNFANEIIKSSEYKYIINERNKDK